MNLAGFAPEGNLMQKTNEGLLVETSADSTDSQIHQEVRMDRVAHARQRLCEGFYNSKEVAQVIAARLLMELNRSVP